MSALPATDFLGRPDRAETERAFARELAHVLRRDVSPNSHFFDELRADSLLMAHFCARVRKRGDLPPVSMRDVYAHPTIRALATAVADVSPATSRLAAAESEAAATATSAREYVICGLLQAIFYLGYSYLGVLAAIHGWQQIVAGSEGAEGYARLVLFGVVAFGALCAVPIAAKWLLIGRWKPRSIRLWSLDYLRFWVVRTLIRSSPVAHLFVGTPLYGLYLRALGAKVGPRVVILSRRMPVCTDLLAIGAGTVVRRDAIFQCYRAHAGRIETGPVTLGQDAFVGERSVLDIGTSMGNGAQLGHGSALLTGQSVPPGERWHGCPAERTHVNYVRVAPARCSRLRRVSYAALTLIAIVFLYVPLLEGGLDLVFIAWSSVLRALDTGGLLVEALTFSLVVFVGAALTGLLAAGVVPRLLRRFVAPDTVHPLFGFRYAAHRVIAGLGRVKFFTFLFGDSSSIVHYLGWLGYRLKPVVQTGSNFGIEVAAANPFLTSVGSGTMVADGLLAINDELSSTSFRVSQVAIGPRNFVGNDVTYPAGGRTGVNCLLATKAMIPIDGKMREDVGLLGSPPFEIPRSVERDSRYDHMRSGDPLSRGLAAKNGFNLRTMALFLLTRWMGVFLVAFIDLAAIEIFGDAFAYAPMAFLFAASVVVAAVYYALVERWVEKLGPPPPRICSMYDPAFWQVERLWKVHPIHFLHIFDGTPFKGAIWRLMGARIGRRVFDDGVHISEPTVTAIGDESVLNHRSKIQCHSQEDGTFKSAPSVLGAGCTIGVGALVHYGVTIGDGAALAADSFLMKGEYVPPRARWAGNPARET